MSPRTTVCRSSSPEETAAFARGLAGELAPGAVLALVGGLGSGKTVFAKGIASGLGVPQREAASPTYTLVHEHAGRLPLFHADLYRLSGPAEAEALGLEEYAERGGILVVEWAERAQGLLPPDTVTVHLERTGPRTRTITVTWP